MNDYENTDVQQDNESYEIAERIEWEEMQDISEEQERSEMFQDKLDMFRNEY